MKQHYDNPSVPLGPRLRRTSETAQAECSAEPPNEDVAELSEDVADVADAELEALSISEALERLKEVQGRGGASAAAKPKTDLEVRHYVTWWRVSGRVQMLYLIQKQWRPGAPSFRGNPEAISSFR